MVLNGLRILKENVAGSCVLGKGRNPHETDWHVCPLGETVVTPSIIISKTHQVSSWKGEESSTECFLRVRRHCWQTAHTEKGNAICFYDYLEGVSKGGKSVLKIYPFLTVANLTVKLQITRKNQGWSMNETLNLMCETVTHHGNHM